jgi:DNA-binding transcriptional LysR family regulator
MARQSRSLMGPISAVSDAGYDGAVELRQLRAFVQVAHAGTFTRGAEELYLSQSAVSQAIGRLEAELGFELLRRGRNRVEVTEAGSVVLERARQALAAADAIRSDLTAFSGLLAGTVALGTMLPPGPLDLAELLARFHAGHAGISVRVREGSAAEVLALLEHDGLDAAITGVWPEALPEGLAGHPLTTEELVVIAAPDDPLGRRPTVPLAALTGKPFVGYRRGSALRETIDGALRAAGAEPKIAFESDELVSVRELVARSLGASIVPRSTVTADGPPVAVVEIGPLRLGRPLTLTWRERRQPPAAAAFLGFVRAAAESGRLPLAA